MITAKVPCDGCTVCCTGQTIYLMPHDGDNLADYVKVPAFNPVTQQMGFALPNKENGDCHYLGQGGCTIYGRTPVVCRAFDCRKFVANFGDRTAQRRAVREKGLLPEIYSAARARMHTLEEEPK